VFDNHEPRARKYELARRALGIGRTLVAAGVVEVVRDPVPSTRSGTEVTAVPEPVEGTTPERPRIRLTVDLQPNFALNQPLSPFALAALELLDPESPSYALDVMSVLEATLDDPRPVLSQQQFRARGEAVAAMKAEGIEYDQRMELLEDVTHPRPLAELLEQQFEVFASSQPWIRDFELRPKSVVRDMFERAMTFGEFVSFYNLGRSEGLVLRYLSDAYRAVRQTVPEEAKTEDLLDLIEWLGELVRQVDSSLVDEWTMLVNPAADPDAPVVPPAPPSVLTNRRAFLVLVRNELFRRVQLAALDDAEALAELDGEGGLDADAWGRALDDYYAEHDSIGTGPDARSSRMLLIEEGPELWKVRQILDDPAGHHDWGITAEVDLAASEEQGIAVVRVTGLNRL
jgi:hypothetical protein